jgi:hypothetical protein
MAASFVVYYPVTVQAAKELDPWKETTRKKYMYLFIFIL